MMPTEMTNGAQQDESAVAAVRRGDAERYRELVERHERRVFAVAWSRLGDAALAEEAAQEAFIRGYRRLWLLGDGAKFAAWITTIARHAAINLGLRHRRELNKRERWALEQPAAAGMVTGETTELCPPETLRQTLAELPAAHRECLVLFYLEGKSGAEAAATLGISEAALRVRLHRARAVLRERLEEKLEGSLANLRPAKTLVPAVMAAVLVSSSAKAAAGGTVAFGMGAKIVSLLGKTFLFSWLLPFFSVVMTLPNLLLLSFIMRKERQNFRDAEGFRPELHRRYFRSFIWGFPLFLLGFTIISYSALGAWGINAHQFALAGLALAMTLIAARSLTICRNQYQVGMFAYCLIIAIGLSTLALGWIPRDLAQLPLLLATMLFFLIFKKRPARMDYSLFLRAAHGLLKFSSDADEPPSADYFNRRELLAFARFLGARFLVNNFRWETNGLALRLPPVGNRFLTSMATIFLPPISQNCSHILLGCDGSIRAHCGQADAQDLAALKSSSLTGPQDLESLVEENVAQAWQEFRSGNLPAAERAVGDSPESDVFVVPPARAKSMRWWRIFIGASVALMAVGMIMQLLLPDHSSQSSFRLKRVELTADQVRYSLEQKAGFTNFDEATKYGDNLTPVFNLVLPPTNLMSAETMEKMRALISQDFKSSESDPAARVRFLLGAEILQRAVVNDWFTKEQLGFTDEIVRQTIANASKFQKQQWFQLQPIPTMTSEFKNGRVEHKRVNYTVLEVDRLALTVRCLDKLGCLDAMQDKSVTEMLLHHQILTDQTPPGRRPMADPKSLHGLFYTMGYDPILDTYESLVVLEKLGRLDQVNQAACVDGILRFHGGGGLFASPNKGDGLVVFGDARDTIAAFESLRILGALDRVKNLDKWKFSPNFTSRMPDGVKQRVATWDEIEAWVCQQRLEKILRERKENPTAPVRSLLEP